MDRQSILVCMAEESSSSPSHGPQGLTTAGHMGAKLVHKWSQQIHWGMLDMVKTCGSAAVPGSKGWDRGLTRDGLAYSNTSYGTTTKTSTLLEMWCSLTRPKSHRARKVGLGWMSTELQTSQAPASVSACEEAPLPHQHLGWPSLASACVLRAISLATLGACLMWVPAEITRLCGCGHFWSRCCQVPQYAPLLLGSSRTSKETHRSGGGKEDSRAGAGQALLRAAWIEKQSLALHLKACDLILGDQQGEIQDKQHLCIHK